MDEPFSGLDLIMEAKVCELVNKIACLDESNTIIVVTHDAAATVADHLRLMGRDRDAGSSIIPGARVQETYDLVVRDLHPGITNSTALLEFVREVKEGFRLYNPNRLAGRHRRPTCGRQATTRTGNACHVLAPVGMPTQGAHDERKATDQQGASIFLFGTLRGHTAAQVTPIFSCPYTHLLPPLVYPFRH